ncbi:MAG: MFS transporter [Pseudomonadota bacterium]
MRALTQKLGNWIDAAWEAMGLDLEGFARVEPDHARRVGVWLLAVGQTIGYGGIYYIFATLLFTWENTLDWGKGALTLAFSLAILTSAVVSPFAGKLIDRGLGRWLLSGGLTLGGLALILLGFAQSYPAFLAAWVLLGVAQGSCLYDPCFAFLTRTTGAKAAQNITRVALVAGFASTLAYPSGTYLAEAYDWSVAVWVFAAVVILAGAPALFAGATLIECCPHQFDPDAARAQNKSAFRRARERRAFWLIFTAFPLIGMAVALTLAHVIPILIEGGLSLGHAVLAASLIGPMQVLGRLVMLRVAGHVGPVIMALLSFTSILIAMLILTQLNGLPAIALAFALLFGAGYGMESILKPMVMADVLGRDGFGIISGFMAMPYLAAVAMAPQIGSVLWGVGGYNLALLVGAGAAAVALSIMSALYWHLNETRA